MGECHWVIVTPLEPRECSGLAEELGDGFVEVGKECIEFTRIDRLIIKVRVDSMRMTFQPFTVIDASRNFQPFTVTDGSREYNIAALPMVYQQDLRWDEKEM